jgi:hypothetical protein
MTSLFWTSYLLLWILVTSTALLILLLYRQYGLTLLAPRESINAQGLDVGSTAPALRVRRLRDDREVNLEWKDDHKAGSLVVLALETCPICKRLLGGLDEVAARWRGISCIWIDGERSEANVLSPAGAFPSGWLIAKSDQPNAHVALDPPVVPFGYVIDHEGRIAAKGLVNQMGDLDLLLNEAFPGGLGHRASQLDQRPATTMEGRSR